jgi:hypothetical protein
METLKGILRSEYVFFPLFIAGVIIFISCVAYVAAKKENQHEVDREKFRESAYHAWCKETGNPKELTLEEFKILHIRWDHNSLVVK